MIALCIRLALVSAVGIGAACADSRSPTMPSPPTASLPRPEPAFPAVTRPARVFSFSRELNYAVSGYTVGSRFVLYDDGGFALQYLQSAGSSEYRGTYVENGRSINFAWEGWSAAGPWGATGELTGDLLAVRYNLIMELSDFENAVYVRTP